MAGHVAFGARTGGATVILGITLLLLALFLSGSVQTLFSVLPKPILGVILFITGAQLALGSCDFSKHKGERFITLITAAFCIWNVGVGFLAGIVGMIKQMAEALARRCLSILGQRGCGFR